MRFTPDASVVIRVDITIGDVSRNALSSELPVRYIASMPDSSGAAINSLTSLSNLSIGLAGC